MFPTESSRPFDQLLMDDERMERLTDIFQTELNFKAAQAGWISPGHIRPDVIERLEARLKQHVPDCTFGELAYVADDIIKTHEENSKGTGAIVRGIFNLALGQLRDRMFSPPT